MNVLDDILRAKRRELAAIGDPSAVAAAESAGQPSRDLRDFAAALRGPRRAIIAELKPRSPSAGPLASEFDPVSRARSYAAGGAVALSVLTDRTYFGGSVDHLVAARQSTSLPVLRKDFLIDPRQVEESHRLGADACLLIVAALAPSQLGELLHAVEAHGMTALVEVHTERELEVAVETGAGVIGVNSRNLATLAIDTELIHRLAPRVPAGTILVAESGIARPEDVHSLPDRVGAVLIGTALMRSPDPAAFIRACCKEVVA